MLGFKMLPFDRTQKGIRPMTKTYQYKNKDLTVRELVALSDGIGYDAMLNRLRQGWSVEDAVNTPLHSRPSKATKIDLLNCIPRANTFDGRELTKQDKVVITGMIADYLERKQRGITLLEQKKDPKQMPRV